MILLLLGLSSPHWSTATLTCPSMVEYESHPTSCSQFLHCSPLGPPAVKSCPLGTNWAVNTSSCDWPHLAQCSISGVQNKSLDDEGFQTPKSGDVEGEGIQIFKAACTKYLEDTFLSWREQNLPPPHPDFLPANSAPACQAFCRAEPLCAAWNWNPSFGCNLKKGVSGSRRYLGWTSGLNHFCETGNTEDTGQTTAPAPGPQCRTLQGSPCIFPFTFKGEQHKACTKEQSVNGKPWCAVKVSPSGTVLSGQWGDCSPGCPVTGGGSKLGLCTARCGDTQPQV